MSPNSSSNVGEDPDQERLLKAADEEGFLIPPKALGPDSLGDHTEFGWLESEFGFSIGRLAGAGGTSNVYVASAETKKFAVKVFNRSVRDEASRIRFDKEVAALRKLDHPNISRIINSGITPQGHPFIIFDFVDGVRIDRHCADHNLTLNRSIEILAVVCDALQFAHSRSIIHRDITPNNILVTDSGVPFLTDFGLSKAFDDPRASFQTRTGVVLGTLNYLPPEQLFGESGEVSCVSDIFGIGAVLHVLLTRRPPFQFGNLVQAATEYFRQLPTKFNDSTIPSDLQAICLKCLSASTDERYENAAGLAHDLRQFVDGQAVSAKPPSVVKRYVRVYRENWVVATVITISLVLLLASSLILFSFWQAARTNLELSKQSNNISFDAMKKLSTEVTKHEGSSKSLEVRHDLLEIMCDSYERQLKIRGGHELLMASARADYRLGIAKEHKGDLAEKISYLTRAANKFQQLIDEDEGDTEARYGLFSSYLWLQEYENALEHINILVERFPDRYDYLEARCTNLYLITKSQVAMIEIDKARQYLKALESAVWNLPRQENESKTARKKISVFNLKAKLAIIDGNYDVAVDALKQANGLFAVVRPLVHETHGESIEYMSLLRFWFALSAFMDDDPMVEDIFQKSVSFYERAKPKFGGFIHFYATQCDLLNDYAFYCSQTRDVKRFEEIRQRWSEVIESWSEIDEQTELYHQYLLEYQVFPILSEIDSNEVQSTLSFYRSRSGERTDLVVGRAYIAVGELEAARQVFLNLQVDDAWHPISETYLTQLAKPNPGEWSVEMESREKTRKVQEVLANYESFSKAMFYNVLQSDVNRIKSNLGHVFNNPSE